MAIQRLQVAIWRPLLAFQRHQMTIERSQVAINEMPKGNMWLSVPFPQFMICFDLKFDVL